MNETLFYVFGIALVVSALAVAAIGLRREGFPPTRALLVAIIVYFAGMVAATTTFAVLNAADEQQARETELASEEAAEPPATTTTETTTPATTTPAAGGEATTLKLAADPSAIAYDTTQLTGETGEVTIDFTNPSAVTHDVCLDSPDGQEIGCSETISQGGTSLTEALKPGDYTFFCSVDGHRQAGMEGTLTIN